MREETREGERNQLTGGGSDFYEALMWAEERPLS